MRDARLLYQIQNKAEKDEAEILIYDEIGRSFWGDGIAAEQFVKDLAKVTAKKITVRINSAGGQVFEGLAIYNALRRHDATVVTEIDSLAASIASVIALAGSEVRMADNAFFMIHNAHGLAIGNAADMREMADLLDKVGGSLLNVYAEHTGKDAETVQAWMDAETWFTAEEAKEAGFVHAITKGKDIKAAADLSGFSKVPAALLSSNQPIAAGGHAAPEPKPAPNEPAPKATEESMSDKDTSAQNGAGTLDAIKAERERARQIRAICQAHKVEATKADKWVEDGLTVEQVNAAVLAELQAKQAAAPNVKTSVADLKDRKEDDPRRGFRNHREFLVAVMENAGLRERGQVADERLRPLAQFDKDDRLAAGELAFLLPTAFTPHGIRAAAGSDEQGGYQDRYGGFAVPTSMLPGILEVGGEADPTAGRTQTVPMATPTVDILARTDKNHATSVSGGFTVTRRPETVAATASRTEIEKVSLKATGLFGLAFATEEILVDSPISFAAIIASGFESQFAFHLFNEKIRGLGGSEYLGVLNAPALVSVAKEGSQAADTIVIQNVINMRARAWGYGNAIWIANHDTFPQLVKMALVVEGSTGGGLVLVYQQSLQEDRPDTLLGRPIFYSEHASKLGDKGDIILANWSQYLEGTYQPMQSAESVHVRFVNHERAFKFWIRNAGQPWWRSALTPHKGANTLSPFVTLDERA